MHGQSHYRESKINMSNLCCTDVALQLNCAGVVECTNCHTAFRRNDYYLLYMLDKHLMLSLPMLSYETILTGGDFIIISPETSYEYFSFPGECINYLWLHFTGRDAVTQLSALHLPINRSVHIGTRQPLLECWNRIFFEFIKRDAHFDSMTEIILREILLQLSRALTDTHHAKSLEKSILYIHEHYATDFNIGDLAKMEGLSETHYRARFKQLAGVSPNAYIIERRINAAMSLLDNTEMDLAQIAVAVGYQDPYYFGRLFKARIGVSPGRYRKKSRT